MSVITKLVCDLTENIIAFQHNFLVLEETCEASADSRTLAATIQAELMNVGYMLTEAAFDRLCRTSENKAVGFWQEVVGWVKSVIGDGSFAPLYSGFPTQVMEMSHVELFLNAILHYMSGGTFIPNSYPKTLSRAFERVKYRMIDLGTREQFNQIFTDLLSVNQSITPTDQETLRWFARTYPREEVVQLVPASIPFKENLCWLAVELDLYPKKMTATDALRIIVGKSEGNILLTKKADKIKHFNRAERRALLSMLEEIHIEADEMKKYEKRWIRVGEALHPGDYAKQFPHVWKQFRRLRNGKVKTWNGAVETASTLEQKLDLLAQRPGEFARRLDALLRKGTQAQAEHVRKLYRARRRKQQEREDWRVRKEVNLAIKRAKELARHDSEGWRNKPYRELTGEQRLAIFPGQFIGHAKELFLELLSRQAEQERQEIEHMKAQRAANRERRKAEKEAGLNNAENKP